MAKVPKTDPFSDYFASWTQTYVSMNGFWSNEQFERTTHKEQAITVSNELARLDFLEEEIQSMLTYPDAERIINRINRKGKHD